MSLLFFEPETSTSFAESAFGASEFVFVFTFTTWVGIELEAVLVESMVTVGYVTTVEEVVLVSLVDRCNFEPPK